METRSNLKYIYVFAHWEGITEPILKGELRAANTVALCFAECLLMLTVIFYWIGS